jgi:ribonuclease HII
VLGPLVVACVVTDDPAGLRALGARDSKALTADRRAALEAPIRAFAKGFAYEVLEPFAIDRERKARSLNEVEGAAFARAAAAAAQAAGAPSLDLLQADAADAVEENFRDMIVRELRAQAPRLKVRAYAVEHRGDQKFPAVSAASILAKVERDRRVARLAAEIGEPIGSGYPADPVTDRFLRGYISAHKDLPPFARRSWETAQRMLKEAGLEQTPLDAFVHEEERP